MGCFPSSHDKVDAFYPSVAWNLVLSEISLRSSGAPLLFTEYYLQDCKANLDLLQEEAGEVEVSKSSISLCCRINREQELDGTAMPWWLLKVGPVVCSHRSNQTEILSILTIIQKWNQQSHHRHQVLVAPTRNPWSAATWERAPPAWGEGRQRLGRLM